MHIHTNKHDYIYMHTYIHAHAEHISHTWVPDFERMSACACMYVCMYVCTYVRTYVCTQRDMYAYKQTFMNTKRHAYMHTCA